MKKIFTFILFCLLAYLVISGINTYREYKNQEKIDYFNFVEAKEKRQKEVLIKKQKLEYEQCLNDYYTTEMETENLKTIISDIDKITNKYNVSYKYININNQYTKEKNIDKEYYGASLYKLLDVIYLIEKSNNNELDLNTKIKYKSVHKRPFSTGMVKIPINSMVSIKELLSYILLYSDNTAHTVLFDYIGLKNLQDLGKDLGAKRLIEEGTYGQSSVSDIYLYLAKLYELMSLDNENAIFLKEHLNNSNVNSLNFDDIKFYHKYGMYNQFYHNVGIAVLDEPYMILIMSELRFYDYKLIIQNISRHFYNLNEELVNSQKNYCYNLVYGGSLDGQ